MGEGWRKETKPSPSNNPPLLSPYKSVRLWRTLFLLSHQTQKWLWLRFVGDHDIRLFHSNSHSQSGAGSHGPLQIQGSDWGTPLDVPQNIVTHGDDQLVSVELLDLNPQMGCEFFGHGDPRMELDRFIAARFILAAFAQNDDGAAPCFQLIEDTLGNPA